MDQHRRLHAMVALIALEAKSEGQAMAINLNAEVLGIIGDSITFLGAIILAIREAGEVKRTRQAIVAGETLEKYPDLAKLGIEIEGLLIRKEGDIELAIASRSAMRARLGAALIALGFLFLLWSRSLELYESRQMPPGIPSAQVRRS